MKSTPILCLSVCLSDTIRHTNDECNIHPPMVKEQRVQTPRRYQRSLTSSLRSRFVDSSADPASKPSSEAFDRP